KAALIVMLVMEAVVIRTKNCLPARREHPHCTHQDIRRQRPMLRRIRRSRTHWGHGARTPTPIPWLRLRPRRRRRRRRRSPRSPRQHRH
ncbi:hypothetical protein BJ912DRAFT_972676, partial [Pholiota molesta]